MLIQAVTQLSAEIERTKNFRVIWSQISCGTYPLSLKIQQWTLNNNVCQHEYLSYQVFAYECNPEHQPCLDVGCGDLCESQSNALVADTNRFMFMVAKTLCTHMHLLPCMCAPFPYPWAVKKHPESQRQAHPSLQYQFVQLKSGRSCSLAHIKLSRYMVP